METSTNVHGMNKQHQRPSSRTCLQAKRAFGGSHYVDALRLSRLSRFTHARSDRVIWQMNEQTLKKLFSRSQSIHQQPRRISIWGTQNAPRNVSTFPFPIIDYRGRVTWDKINLPSSNLFSGFVLRDRLPRRGMKFAFFPLKLNIKAKLIRMRM